MGRSATTPFFYNHRHTNLVSTLNSLKPILFWCSPPPPIVEEGGGCFLKVRSYKMGQYALKRLKSTAYTFIVLSCSSSGTVVVIFRYSWHLYLINNVKDIFVFSSLNLIHCDILALFLCSINAQVTKVKNQ